MKNRGHYLKRTKRHAVPRDLIVFYAGRVTTDDQQKGFTVSPNYAYAVHYRWEGRQHSGHPRMIDDIATSDRSEFWNWIVGRFNVNRTTWIYTHGLSEHLQLLQFSKYQEIIGLKIKLAVDSNPPCYVKGEFGSSRFILADLKDIIPVCMDTLFDYAQTSAPEEPSPVAYSGHWYDYLTVIVDSILTVLKFHRDMIIDYNLGPWKPTIAQQSWAAFIANIREREILVTPDDMAIRLARQAYHGGRLEARVKGRHLGSFVQLDYNSLYPWIMSTKKLPVRHCGNGGEITVAHLSELLEDYAVIADVTVRSFDQVYPVRGYKEIEYPRGTITTTLSTPELMYALYDVNSTEILRVHEWSAWRTGIIAPDWLEEMWTVRKANRDMGDPIRAKIIKLMMNSLYGKFGQRHKRWVYDDTADGCLDADSWVECDNDTGMVSQYRTSGLGVQRLEYGGETSSSMPEIAAHITAYGRILIHRIMTQVGIDDVFYVDTDGLICRDTPAIDTLVENADELGSIRIVRRANEIVIAGKKCYRIGDTHRESGRRSDAVNIDGWRYRQYHASKWNRKGESLDGTVSYASIERASPVMKLSHYPTVAA